MNSDSENKPPSSQSPSQSPNDSMSKEPEIVDNQGFPDSETPARTPQGESSNSPNASETISNPKSTPQGESSNSHYASAMSNPKSTSDDSDEEFPISSMANSESPTQNPPVQVMERTEEPDTPSAYRIPSHVFDRTKSNTPEWSMESNESLFSIHIGTMSFTKELSWLNNEMNMPISPLPPTAPAPPPATAPALSPVNKFNEISQEGFGGVTEAEAAETMREVIMENRIKEEDCDLTSVSVTSRIETSEVASFHHDQSRHSDGSTKSFAFKV